MTDVKELAMGIPKNIMEIDVSHVEDVKDFVRKHRKEIEVFMRISSDFDKINALPRKLQREILDQIRRTLWRIYYVQ